MPWQQSHHTVFSSVTRVCLCTHAVLFACRASLSSSHPSSTPLTIPASFRPVVPKLVCTWESPGELQKLLCLGLTPRDCDLVGLGVALVWEIYKRPSSDCNVQINRRTAVLDCLPPFPCSLPILPGCLCSTAPWVCHPCLSADLPCVLFIHVSWGPHGCIPVGLFFLFLSSASIIMPDS